MAEESCARVSRPRRLLFVQMSCDESECATTLVVQYPTPAAAVTLEQILVLRANNSTDLARKSVKTATSAGECVFNYVFYHAYIY